MRRAGAAVIGFLIAITPALTASAQSEITLDDLAAAKEERQAIGAELADATEAYDASVARLVELEESLTSLGIGLAESEQELASARLDARQIAVDRYLHLGGKSSALFQSATILDASIRTGYLDILSRVGADAVGEFFALEQSYEDQQVVIENALADQATTKADLEGLAASILDRLDEANRKYDALVAAYDEQEAARRAREEAERLRREEEERRRREATSTTTTSTIAPTTTTGPPAATSTTSTTTSAPPVTTTTVPAAGLVCPVDGAVAFTDTWGDPRSGGRTHQGVDMIAARGTPLVAIEAGTVKRMRNGGLGGITVTLTGSSGDEYYYAHLDGWADGLTVGQSLGTGELLGYVGNTGNAQYTVPHLHFEYHPGGGSPVNPYPLVADLCL